MIVAGKARGGWMGKWIECVPGTTEDTLTVRRRRPGQRTGRRLESGC